MGPERILSTIQLSKVIQSIAHPPGLLDYLVQWFGKILLNRWSKKSYIIELAQTKLGNYLFHFLFCKYYIQFLYSNQLEELNDPIGNHVAMCAVILEEWLHELAAISMEHAVHFTPISLPLTKL